MMAIPFGTLPIPKKVKFDKITMPRFETDAQNVAAYGNDIRKILSDSVLKDMVTEENRQLYGTNTVFRDTLSSFVRLQEHS